MHSQVHKSLSKNAALNDGEQNQKHEVKMPPSMMSNALVNVANLGAIIEGSVSLNA